MEILECNGLYNWMQQWLQWLKWWQWAIAQSLPVVLRLVVGVVLVVEQCCSSGLAGWCDSAPPVGVGDRLNVFSDGFAAFIPILCDVFS
jgi:hypothetical protein